MLRLRKSRTVHTIRSKSLSLVRDNFTFTSPVFEIRLNNKFRSKIQHKRNILEYVQQIRLALVVECRLIKVEDFFFLSGVKFSFHLKKEQSFQF